ncbi:MAG: hypothetical protein ACRDG6_07375 [Candidatus Limnocylindria bacterium]
MSRIVASVFCAVGMAVCLAFAASADDGPLYHRTTPRGSFGQDGSDFVVGVPGGRAWGIESALIPVSDQRIGYGATVVVSDPTVREAFVRVAWYDRATGRPRQFALTDARLVRAGETATLELALDPPAGAVAYRIRVLARLRTPQALSAPDAVRVTLSAPFPRPAAFPPTRLLP